MPDTTIDALIQGSSFFDTEAAIEEVFDNISAGREGALKFMVSLFIPWMRYILNPEEANQNYPHCVPREDAPGQPWDIAGGDPIQPNEHDILKAMKSWLGEYYDNFKAKLGHSSLPNKYNVLYGGEFILFWGSIWNLSEDELLNIASDTKVMRVVHTAIKDGIMPPPQEVFKEVWEADYMDYDTAQQRADAIAQLLEVPLSKARDKSISRLMREAVTGTTESSGQVSADPESTTLTWTFSDREQMEAVTEKIGLPVRDSEPSKALTTARQITSALISGDRNLAKTLTQELITQLETI